MLCTVWSKVYELEKAAYIGRLTHTYEVLFVCWLHCSFFFFIVWCFQIGDYKLWELGIEAEAIITYLIRAWMDNNRHIYSRIHNMYICTWTYFKPYIYQVGSIADVFAHNCYNYIQPFTGPQCRLISISLIDCDVRLLRSTIRIISENWNIMQVSHKPGYYNV